MKGRQVPLDPTTPPDKNLVIINSTVHDLENAQRISNSNRFRADTARQSCLTSYGATLGIFIITYILSASAIGITGVIKTHDYHSQDQDDAHTRANKAFASLVILMFASALVGVVCGSGAAGLHRLGIWAHSRFSYKTLGNEKESQLEESEPTSSSLSNDL